MKIDCLVASETPVRSPDRVEHDKWLVTNLTVVRLPDRVKYDFFGVILDIFGQFRQLLWSGSWLCDVVIFS